MEDARQGGTQTSIKSYDSNRFKRRPPKDPLDTAATKASSLVKGVEEAPNTLNVSYLQNAPSQLASNHRWYEEDLSRAPDMTVRLLYLEPGQKRDPIAGKLVCHLVQEKPRYDALSYAWGEQDEWAEITLNETPGFAVTRTLWAALRRLRSTAVARPIWIDAICITKATLLSATNRLP